jgi:hypothetical protein
MLHCVMVLLHQGRFSIGVPWFPGDLAAYFFSPKSRSFIMKVSLIALLACCAATSPALASQSTLSHSSAPAQLTDMPGSHPPQLRLTDMPGSHPPQLQLTDMPGSHPPQLVTLARPLV